MCVCACAELRRQEETGQLLQPVLFVLLVLVSVLLYFAVSLMDPGFILAEDAGLQVTDLLPSSRINPGAGSTHRDPSSPGAFVETLKLEAADQFVCSFPSFHWERRRSSRT